MHEGAVSSKKEGLRMAEPHKENVKGYIVGTISNVSRSMHVQAMVS